MDSRQAALTGRKCLRCHARTRLSVKHAPTTPASARTLKKAEKPRPALSVPAKAKHEPIGYATEGSTLTPPPASTRLVSTKLTEDQYQAGQALIDANPELYPSWYAFVRAGVAMLLQAMEEE